MKKILFIVFIALSLNAIGQKTIVVYSDKSLIYLNEEISLRSQFLDSLFYQGKVIFKNGKTSSALMDYNLLDNGISFVDKNKNVLILDGLEEISFVIYNKRIFIPYQGYLLEQIDTYKNDISLFLKRKTTIKTNATNGAYGMNTESSNVTRYSSLSGPRSEQTYNDLNKELRVDVTLESEFFLKMSERFVSVSRIKDLKKLFPAKKDSILNFISSNKLNLSNPNDLKQIIRYCVEVAP
jgi:hypothetical protein